MSDGGEEVKTEEEGDGRTGSTVCSMVGRKETGYNVRREARSSSGLERVKCITVSPTVLTKSKKPDRGVVLTFFS